MLCTLYVCFVLSRGKGTTHQEQSTSNMFKSYEAYEEMLWCFGLLFFSPLKGENKLLAGIAFCFS